MVASIGSTASTVAPVKASGGDAVELARLRKEYSACVNCSSATTSEGKRGIQQLDNQIKTLESRMKMPPQATPSAVIAAATSPATSSTSLIDVYA